MRNLKLFKMALPALLCATLAGCGGGDSDDNLGSLDGGSIDTWRVPANALYTDLTGSEVLLRSISGRDTDYRCSFNYDANGICTRIGRDLSIFYSGSLIVFGQDTQANFTLNTRGHVTAVNVRVGRLNGSSEETAEAWLRYSYDGKGFLVRHTYEYAMTATDLRDGTESRGSGNGEMNLTWRDGLLTGARSAEEWTEDEAGGYAAATYLVEGSGVVNTLGQYTLAYAGFFDDTFGMLAMVGMLGNVPQQFVGSVGVSWEETGDEGYGSGAEVTEYEYTFYSNGMISSETVGDEEYRYSYDQLADFIGSPSRSGARPADGVRRFGGAALTRLWRGR